MSQVEKRESLSSGFGFLLLSAGCAVGLGNVWRFPFVVGQNGGAIFVLLYVFFLLIFGVPMLVAEFAVGRAAKRSLSVAYETLCPETKVYKTIGRVQQCGNWLLMMFYTTVAGWMLAYPVNIILKRFDMSKAQATFDAFKDSPVQQVSWMLVAIVIGFTICAFGLQKGVERVTKCMMVTLFFVLIGLCFYVLTLDGAMEGVKFYLMPDVAVLKERPLIKIIEAALGQSFFTLSIGIGSMAIFGSYTSRRRRLTDSAIQIVALDTLVAILAGLIIFPACAAYGMKADSGPALIFITLPTVFSKMPFGEWVGIGFFIFLGMAALTTVIAVFENIIAMTMELRHWTRAKTICFIAPVLTLLSIPCALGFNLLKNVHPLGKGSDILGLEDFLVSNLILPIGALAILIFCVCKRFWGWDKFLKEVNTGSGISLSPKLRIYITYILPVILSIAILSWIINAIL